MKKNGSIKRLYLLRHSKAGQTNKKLTDDHERPLTQKGIDLCKHIADNLKELGDLPELVVSSTSRRTKETAEHLFKHLGRELPTEFSPKLYLAGVDDIYDQVRSLEDELNNILILGHNPGLQMFCMHLAGSGSKRMYRELKNQFPPGTLVAFDLEIDSWLEVKPNAGKLVGYANPKKPVMV